MQKSLSDGGNLFGGGEGRRGSRKERIRTVQVTDKEQSTNVRAMVV